MMSSILAIGGVLVSSILVIKACTVYGAYQQAKLDKEIRKLQKEYEEHKIIDLLEYKTRKLKFANRR